MRRVRRYALLALGSAALFGASTPLAKRLLEELAPLQLAGLLYLGSGAALALVWLARALRGSGHEAKLARRDLPFLAGSIACGGMVAPWLLLVGLSGMSASGASLLLNFEAVFTVVVAALTFREAVTPRVWTGALVMLAGALVLAWSPGATFSVAASLAVLGACLLWAADNNLTRSISSADPVAIAGLKGLSAGAVNLVLAAAAGAELPSPASAAGALSVGAVSYGASLVLYVLALRHLGVARTAAHFGTAPFIGAALAVILLGEPIDAQLVAGFVLMLLAVWIVLREAHGHEHSHETLGHVHRHVHDAHHQHAHRGDEGAAPHTHWHRHARLHHAHPHYPDLHHRHGH